MSAVLSMWPSASLTQSLFSQGVRTWAQAPLRASTASATPARMCPVTAPPGEAATAAPLSPAMNAPEAATWWSGTGSEGATRFEDVEVGTACVEAVVADADDGDVTAAPDVDDTGAEFTDTAMVDAVVDDESDMLAFVVCDEPDEQAAPPRAMMTSSARSFTAA